MKLTDLYRRLPVKAIVVRRDDRQRRSIDTAQGRLKDSIALYGVLNPIIIDHESVLVAGERRLAASIELGLPDIPVRFIEDLSADEAMIVELEENLKRTDLPWRDEVAAIARLHSLYRESAPEWTYGDTEKALSISNMSQYLRVARDLSSPRIASATSLRQAYNTLARVDERLLHNALNDISDAAGDLVPPPPSNPQGTPRAEPVGGAESEGSSSPTFSPKPVQTAALAAEASILNTNFIEWAPAYTGPRFNFLHCDFPYGINMFQGPWSGKNSWRTLTGGEPYDDSADLYPKLVAVLCENLDRLLAPSAHLMFWLPGDIEIQFRTLELFSRLAPRLTFDTYPLIWHKTDNVGIMPDARRGPRRVYETALMAYTEDRPVVKPVANAYGSPTDKLHHPSTKPEPMLRHFLQMFIDEHSTVFDPTCGSGAALRAAESLGAASVLGLEIDTEYAESARGALRTFRNLRKMRTGGPTSG